MTLTTWPEYVFFKYWNWLVRQQPYHPKSVQPAEIMPAVDERTVPSAVTGKGLLLHHCGES